MASSPFLIPDSVVTWKQIYLWSGCSNMSLWVKFPINSTPTKVLYGWYVTQKVMRKRIVVMNRGVWVRLKDNLLKGEVVRHLNTPWNWALDTVLWSFLGLLNTDLPEVNKVGRYSDFMYGHSKNRIMGWGEKKNTMRIKEEKVKEAGTRDEWRLWKAECDGKRWEVRGLHRAMLS